MSFLQTKNSLILELRDSIETKLLEKENINYILESLNYLSYLPKGFFFSTSGVISSAGDNTILDISALDSYTGSNKIIIQSIRIQNESGEQNTVLIKGGSRELSRVYTETAGSGIDRVYPIGAELILGTNEDLILNLSAANSVGYSLEYFVE